MFGNQGFINAMKWWKTIGFGNLKHGTRGIGIWDSGITTGLCYNVIKLTVITMIVISVIGAHITME